MSTNLVIFFSKVLCTQTQTNNIKNMIIVSLKSVDSKNEKPYNKPNK
jgi:hypothetical protein